MDEAINLLGLSRATINRLIARQEIPSYKIGKRRFFDQDELAEWVKGRKHAFHLPPDRVREALMAMQKEFMPELIKNLNAQELLALFKILGKIYNQSIKLLLRPHTSSIKSALISLFSQKKS